MALLLAPYNDSMRLGMGFNSYTQTLCVDNAVKVTGREVVRTEDPSQIVTYSSKIVESLSEVVGSMNISYSTSIRKGTVELAGSSNSIQEDKIKQADMNAVVSVKVVNQTTIINEDSQFVELSGVVPGTKDFDDAFGDCYISGFIEGGDFNGIISIRVMDRSKVSSVASAIKKGLSTGSGKDFTLDMDSFSTGMAGSSALRDTETTISVSWMGGGQIKDPRVQWDIDSIFAAAAAFPSQVAKCPQRTWAILTKYRANRSFQAKLSRVIFSPLEYDAVASYTVELFENFMEYKQLMKLVQDIMANTANYLPQKDKHNAITLDIKTLVAVRTAFRHEMNKIVQAVGVLSEDPNSLKRNAGVELLSNDAVVRQILKEAFSGETWQKHEPSKPTAGADTESWWMAFDQNSKSTPLGASSDANTKTDTVVSTATNANVEGTTQQPPDSRTNVSAQTSTDPSTSTVSPDLKQEVVHRREINFDFSKLIAPEVWSDLLPRPKTERLLEAETATKMPDSMGARWAHAPVDDSVVGLQKGTPKVKLTILAAACGLTEITEQLSKLVTSDEELRFTGQQLKDYTANHAIYNMQVAIPLQVGILYQYTGDTMRLKMVKDLVAVGLDQSYQIDPKSKDTAVVSSAWNADLWSTTAVTYDGKCLNADVKIMDWYEGELRTMRNGLPQRAVLFDNEMFPPDPSSTQAKLGMIFYQVQEGGRMRVAVGIQDKIPAVLTDDLVTNFVQSQSEIASLKQDQLRLKRFQSGGEARSSFYDSANNTDSNRFKDIGPMLPERYKKIVFVKGGTIPYPFPPRLLYGLSAIRPQVASSLQIFGFDVVPHTIGRNGFQAVPWCQRDSDVELRMSWLALPPFRDPDTADTIQIGYTETDFTGRSPRVENSISLQCEFNQEFAVVPKVVCWLVGVDVLPVGPDSEVMIEVAPTEVERGRFTILISINRLARGTVPIKIGWLAYSEQDHDKTIKVDTFSVAKGKKIEEFVRYAGEGFTTFPAQLCAITGFTFRRDTRGSRLDMQVFVRSKSKAGYTVEMGIDGGGEYSEYAEFKAVVVSIEP